MSPNGKRVLYVSNVAGPFQVWVMRADGSGQHRVVKDPEHDAFVPRWSPDGTHLLFTRCSLPFGFTRVHDRHRRPGRQRPARHHRRPLGRLQRRLFTGRVEDRVLRRSQRVDVGDLPQAGRKRERAPADRRDPGGLLARLPARRAADRIRRQRRPADDQPVDDAPGRHAAAPDHPHHRPDKNLGFARYAPDGTHLVADYFDGSTDWLVTMNLDGSGLTKIVNNGDADASDPRRLGGVVMMHRMRVLVAVCAAALTALVFSPAASATAGDGLLAFDDFNTGQIYTVTQSGTHVTQLTHVTGDSFALEARWSPNGRRIAFVIIANGLPTGSTRWPRTAATSTSCGTTVLRWTNESPDYFPGGNRFVFSRCHLDNSGCVLATVGINGTGLRTLTSSRFEVYDVSATVSPDGGRIAFTRFNADGVHSQVWVMKSDGSGAHAVTAACARGDSAVAGPRTAPS